MVWTDAKGGLFMLQAVGQLDGSPAVLQYSSFGIDATRVAQLKTEVVPGSGLPYILDDPDMTLLAQGLTGFGSSNSVSQRYIPTAGDGDVLLSVGDYNGQLHPLGDDVAGTQVTIAGLPGYRYTNDSATVYVWHTPANTWAELRIATPLADRADEIVASLVPAALPTELTTTTTVAAPTIAPSTGPTIIGVTGTLAVFTDVGHDTAPGTPAPTFNALVPSEPSSNPLVFNPALGEARPTLLIIYPEWSPHSRPLLETAAKAKAKALLPAGTAVVLVRTADGGGAPLFNSDDVQAWGYGDARPYLDNDAGDGSPGQAATAYGASAFPFLVVIGPDGVVQRRASGEMSTDEFVRFVSGAETEPQPFRLTAPGTGLDVGIGYDQFGFHGWFVLTDAPSVASATPTDRAFIIANPDRNSTVSKPDWTLGQQVVFTDRASGATITYTFTGWDDGDGTTLHGTSDRSVVVLSFEGPGNLRWNGYLVPTSG
jgi:hypothetical protein